MSLRFALCLVLVAWLPAGCQSAFAGTADADPSRQIVVTIANRAGPGLGGAASTWKGWSWTGGYRVSPAASALARSIADDYRLEEVDSWPISMLGEYCVVYLVADGDDRADVVNTLRLDRRIRIAQPLNVFTTTSIDSSDRGDPYQKLQRAHNELSLADLHSITTGRGVKIAVVDTGAEFGHPDLRNNVARHADFVGRQGDDFGDDIHGTAIAGIIAATADNREGILGVAPEAELILLKACWPIQEGRAAAQCNSFTLARALVAAREFGVDVLNLSLGGPSDQLLEELLLALIDGGITVIGAEPGDEARQPFPSSIDAVIAVRGSDRAVRASRRSVPAPGTDIITTVPIAEYQYLSGNSIAVAHVTGTVALLRQLDKRLSSARLAGILYDSVPNADSPGKSVSACHAVAAVTSGIACD